jgi:hypothetical protein
MNNLSWKYVKPLKNPDTVISSFESKRDIKLPTDIVNCFKEFNGGRPNKKLFNTDKSNERIIKTLLSFNDEDPETISSVYDMLRVEGQNLIPLASDPGGNFICYSEKYGIVLWLHEINSFEQIANNFTQFLNILY